MQMTGGAKVTKFCPVTACDDMDLTEVNVSCHAGLTSSTLISSCFQEVSGTSRMQQMDTEDDAAEAIPAAGESRLALASDSAQEQRAIPKVCNACMWCDAAVWTDVVMLALEEAGLGGGGRGCTPRHSRPPKKEEVVIATNKQDRAFATGDCWLGVFAASGKIPLY